ncbi:Uncharacterized protein AC499_1128 [Pseudomonas amygdali pv. lachrymans]|uniref:Uncharacterized protein n=1 Tax=Pseudomonas amygdali pv. lachrymans TaxID=53707 RepID=A0ABR5KQE3_PSEAV|nr:Uncharacterized protein AC499_0169 [Pseudomonas amygdali pv. lachrymans]KPC17926.1 Uncharacterized protein AC499_1128 [Pseudomonas amygdali pv. lachrymans]RMT05884.1 hypothetical protein ALP54_102511 [Pseudomonas amygdali pv. lachrymans]
MKQPGTPIPAKRIFYWLLARVLVLCERIKPAGKPLDLD